MFPTVVIKSIQNRTRSHAARFFGVPHDGSDIGLRKDREVLIGSKIKDRLVKWKIVAAQNACEHLPAFPESFSNGEFEEFNQGIPHIHTVLAQGAFCKGTWGQTNDKHRN